MTLQMDIGRRMLAHCHRQDTKSAILCVLLRKVALNASLFYTESQRCGLAQPQSRITLEIRIGCIKNDNTLT